MFKVYLTDDLFSLAPAWRSLSKYLSAILNRNTEEKMETSQPFIRNIT